MKTAALWASSPGRKMQMALTGLTLAAWTLLHMAGNLLLFAGPETMNAYAAALQGSPLVWLMRLGLLWLVGRHMLQALRLYLDSRRAQAGPARRRYRRTSVSARGMRAGGIAIAAFVVYHLLHLYGPLHPSFVAGDVHHNMVTGFRSPAILAVYLVATIAFAMHLRHGLFSAMRSLGVSTGERASRWAVAAAAVIAFGYTAPCLACAFGWLS